MAHDILFQPIRIGPVDIKNRLALTPTNNLFSVNHIAAEKSLGFYAARAKGGLGLIIFEATFVYDEVFDTSSPQPPSHQVFG
jgi:2,4-dienoyl-CoA reductase-like NADH-dependent reductase (Old Yellow Enzyme family)